MYSWTLCLSPLLAFTTALRTVEHDCWKAFCAAPQSDAFEASWHSTKEIACARHSSSTVNRLSATICGRISVARNAADLRAPNPCGLVAEVAEANARISDACILELELTSQEGATI